jgi:hypothetical protein
VGKENAAYLVPLGWVYPHLPQQSLLRKFYDLLGFSDYIGKISLLDQQIENFQALFGLEQVAPRQFIVGHSSMMSPGR